MAGEAEHGGSGFNIHPMDQFKVTPLFGGDSVHWYTPTNATLWMLLTVLAITLVMVVGARGRALIPSRAQSAAEVIYGFTRRMVEDVAGKEGMKYFPYILTVFLFILFANLLALLPTSFAPTSHIAVTGVLAVAVFVTVTAIGFVKHGAGFLKLFWVTSAPTVALRIVLAMIELISYFVRPLSHSVRLGGNMMAGHAVLKVFAGFAGALGLGAIFPIVAIVAVYGLELMVACIQAYVFAILTCVYLNDALHPGH
ncbi:MAG TPA: F0F1 ATP synthase subunit A [Amaricoccus sp.]|uniref:F0F1 ATP synthase subunit A n=1 Tax=Amaricoccus sp. TaxID=1872485 RepID=UPI001E134F32|nr:F0F1 ATP synthase subunit A [Amaricoccus sp.]MCB1370317.1 F0F1 ATP synthase subunit A [Paracoccaceae bacterium]MCC0067050.1 F0F1 ATP synthase subunit A [Rhodovulum sp.]MCB1374854.1 F0F1 ATP synthase subunit A [Paracoccaceae bacterium]MCB1403852.1 F0F1 ATP synthase subunit A [Paracoccaceae bacterium]HPG22023.1 F0F1 ATP synthase subunit A [Amaricoccus sp.]